MKKISYQLTSKIILIKIFFFLIFNSYAYSYYKKHSEISLPDEIFIELEKKELGQYGNFIYEINNDKSPNIHPDFKKYLNAKISFKVNEKFIKNNIELRIVGDWKDHIDTENLISSLQIKIKDKNLGGIRKFRLYLPHTRQGNNEILWSTVHEVFGFPTQHRQIIKVNFNNNNYLALFEESTEKEFLERWSFRESPIIEYDERQIWLDRYNSISENLIDKDSNRFKIDNASFIKNNLDTFITQKALNIKNNQFIKKFDFLNEKIGEHSLIKHNRKFIYDPIYNIHIPLYFDGNIIFDKVLINDLRSCEKDIKEEWKKNEIKLSKKFELIISIFENRSKQIADDKVKCIVKKILVEKNFDLETFISNEINRSIRDLNNYKYNNKVSENLEKSSFFYGFNLTKKKFCKSIESKIKECTTLKFSEIRELLVAKLSVTDETTPFNIGFFNDNKIDTVKNKLKEVTIDKNTEIYVEENTNLYMNLINKSQKKINLNINLENNRTSKVIIFSSKLNNLNILVNSMNKPQKKSDNKIRYNENLLTGCLTIIDSKFDNVSISSNGTGCEDDINIFRSIGNINEILVKNSDFDSVDLDYSNLIIEKINIKNAGNDCLDFSFGKILIKNAYVENCNDKGISVGEKTKFVAYKINILSSKTGIANKDGSTSYIKEINVDNVDTCMENYQKKQEFEMGFLNVVKSNCNKENIPNFNKITNKKFKEIIKDNV